MPSATARWYYDDEDLVKSDIDYPKPLLILVTTRLGLSAIESEYYDAIKYCFTENLPQCVGVLGGKPNFALYFVGMQESNQLVFLDPHFV